MEALVRQIITELRGAWRYRWPAIGLAWLVSLIGWAAVFALPNQYEATAKVFVDTDSAIRPFLQGIAVGDIQFVRAGAAVAVGFYRDQATPLLYLVHQPVQFIAGHSLAGLKLAAQVNPPQLVLEAC